jgi:hypothetical protein
MAIVKLRYARGRDAIKAHLRYIVHRSSKEQGRLTRELFGHDYQSVTKQEAYDLINRAPKGTVFYKMTINFHPLKEDTHKDLDLQHIASLTVREMQYRLSRALPFVATIHNGHAKTDLRHIHAICLVQGRLSKEEFGRLKKLWQTATAEVRMQRRMRDRNLEYRRTRFLAQAHVLYQYSSSRHLILSQGDASKKLYRRGNTFQMQHGCSSCGYGRWGGIPKGYAYCPCCHTPLNQEKTLRLELARRASTQSGTSCRRSRTLKS